MKAYKVLPGRWMVGNEDGSIIVIAVLLLLLLSLVVIGGSRTSAVEVMIAANKKASERVFYLADGLANQAARIIENQKLLDAAAGTKVLKDSDGWDAGGLRKQDNVLDRDGNVIDISETGGWEGGVSYDWAPTAGAAGQTWPNIAGWGDADGDGVSDNPREATDVFEYLVVDKGVAVGGSLDTSSSSQLREYNLRGRVQSGSVNDEVSVGYRMRVAN